MSTFGEDLRREREVRRISLRDVAEATKINLRYLEALESNQFEQLPGGVFNRGFVRAYAEFIGIDAEMMVNAYLHEAENLDHAGQEPPAGSVGTRLPADRKARAAPGASEGRASAAPRGSGAATPGGKRRTWVLVAIVVAALAIAAAVWWGAGAPGWRRGADSPAGQTTRGDGGR